jgi:hypothetical protein
MNSRKLCEVDWGSPSATLAGESKTGQPQAQMQ